MFTRFSHNIQGIILAFLGFASFAVSDATAKWLTEHYETLHVIGFYNIGILITCTVLQKYLGGFRASFQTKKLKYHIGRGFAYTGLSILIVTALSKLDLSTFYTILFISPFVIALLARFIFKESIGIHAAIAICLGFCGVLIVMRPGLDAFNVWMLAPLFATLFVASLSLLAKSLERTETLLSLAFFPSISNLFFLSIPAIVIYGMPAFFHLPIFLLASSFGTAGLIFTALAYQTAKANIVAPIQYTQIVWGIIFGFVLFGAVPDLWTLIGATIIISAGIYLVKVKSND